MIVYRDIQEHASTVALMTRIRQLARSGDPLRLLLELGELEQGVVDALHPECDGWETIDQVLRTTIVTAAAAWLATSPGGALPPLIGPAGPGDAPDVLSGPAALERAIRRLERCLELDAPREIAVRPPEGFVHYALDPCGYIDAVGRYRSEVGAARACCAAVIGVRSIGTTLSAIVAAAVGSARSVTVRPRGPRGDRQIVIDTRLETLIRTWIDAGTDLLLLDEGPGATGETFASVAAWLEALGAPNARILLFPTDPGHMPLAPPGRRAWFAGTRRYAPPACGTRRLEPLCRSLGIEDMGGLEDFSQGRWRNHLPANVDLPACPIHERVKYCIGAPQGNRILLRYIGLHRWGDAALERAVGLEAAGIGPAVLDAQGGFLACRWVEGEPLVARDFSARVSLAAAPDLPAKPPSPRLPASFLEALSAYLSTRQRLFGTGEPVDRASLLQMLSQNALEALERHVPGLSRALNSLERLPEREASVPDARLPWHEWIRTGEGYVKVDALDHGCGLRYPGPVDRAWDVAGAILEYSLSDMDAARLVSHCAQAVRDPQLPAAVDAYLAPYAALRYAESRLDALEAWSDADRRYHTLEATRFQEVLNALLEAR